MRSLFVLFVLVCSAHTALRSQELFQPMYRHFDVEDGLQSLYLYDVLQDHLGYIWLASDNGIIRFNGHDFEHFGEERGVPSGDYFKIYEAPDSSLWFLSFDQQLLRCDPTQLTFSSPEFNKQLAFAVQGVLQSLVIEGDTFYISVINGGSVRMYPHKEVADSTVVEKLPFEDDIGTYWKHRESGAYTFTQKPLDEREEGVRIHLPDGSSRFLAPQNYRHIDEYARGFTGVRDSSDALIFSTTNFIFRYLPYEDSLVAYPCNEPKTLGLLADTRNRLWVGTYRRGAMIYDIEQPEQPPRALFDGEPISCIYEDAAGGIWLTSLGSGLFYIPDVRSAFTPVKSFKNTYTESVAEVRGMFYYIDQTGKLIAVAPYEDTWQANEVMQFNVRTLVSANVDGYDLYAHSVGNDYFIDRLQGGEHRVQRKRGFQRIVYRSDSVQVSAGSHVFGPVIIVGDDSLFLANKAHFRLTAPSEFGNVLFSNYNHELMFLDREQRKLLSVNLPDNSIPSINEIRFARGDTAWLLSSDRGLYQVVRDSIIDFFDLAKRYPGITCYDLRIQGDSLWLASNKGILISNSKTSQEFWITHEHGLITDIVYGLELSETHVFAVTNRGPCVLERGGWLKPSRPKSLRIEWVRLQDSTWFEPEKLLLPYDYGLLELSWTSFPFTAALYAPYVRYRYRLRGEQTAWVETPENRLQLPSLSAGSYNVEIQVANAQGKWGASVFLPIEVEKPLWENGWFYAVLSVIILSIVSVIASARIRKARAYATLQSELYRAQNQALSAQLNPHFIHNAMNSISGFIAESDQRSALKYLARLSNLMRRVFIHSQAATTPLAQELDYLENYLELESMRFDKKFTYAITVSPEVDSTQVRVPSLLLQPFVENALKHGILPMEGVGTVCVNVSIESEHMVCRITDNGVGIQPTQSQTGQIESSLQAIKHRLRMIQQLFDETIELQIKQLTPGTEVTLRFSLTSTMQHQEP